MRKKKISLLILAGIFINNNVASVNIAKAEGTIKESVEINIETVDDKNHIADEEDSKREKSNEGEEDTKNSIHNNENSIKNIDKINFETNGGQVWDIERLIRSENINIISETSIKKETAKKWAKQNGATDEFIELANLYWKYSNSNGGVNPGIAYIQSAKETGFGKFGGVIDATFKNPCGLKTTQGGDDNDPDAHQRFDSWDQGVQAHLDHLALYAGADGYPRINTFDPRHFPFLLGSAKTVESLGGKWAPSLTYGKEILNRYYNLLSQENAELGWHEINGEKYYINSQGKRVTGLNIIDGSTYFMNNDGYIQYGWNFIEGNWKYFDSDGKMVYGWLLLEDWYYLKSDGNIAQGKEVIDGIEYYFNQSGRMQRNWQFIDGAWSYFNDGIKHIGWLLLEDWYYLKADGKIAQGREIIDGIEYYFNESGRMQRSWQFVDGAWSYFNDGIKHRGWLLLEDWYYLKSDGKIAQGREVIDGIEYYFNDSGRMQRNWQFINGAWSYFNDGIKHIGWLLLEDWYYLKSDGKIAQGREIIDGIEYYFNESGRMQRSWQFVDGAWSYFNDGIKHIGWLEINGSKYYLDYNGKMSIGWKLIKGDKYYFSDSGVMAKNTIIDGFEIGEDGKVKNRLIDIVDLNLNFDFGLSGPDKNNPNKIILHHAAGNSTALNVHNFHKYTNGWAGIGYHFYIHKDGTIYKGREETWRGAHAAEVGPEDGDKSNDTNATSIGIAVQGNYHPETHIATDTKMPKAQEDAIVDLGHYLISKYGLMEVLKHGSPGIGHTSCPGKYYPFDRIKSRIMSKYIYGVYNQEN